MTDPLSFIGEVRRLVGAERLAEATALIQRQLGASPGEPATGDAFAAIEDRTTVGNAAEADAPPPLRTRPRFGSGARTMPVSFARGVPAPDLPPGAQFLSRRHDGPAGGRAYRLFVPSHPAAKPRPLLVMLHGCTQDPEDFALGTRMNAIAEANDVLVAYPRQVRTANASLCWNWFEPAHQARGAGEPAILAAIVAQIAKERSVDSNRIFVAGLSAGGAMAAVLGALYPDVFAAVGVHSGLPFKSADSVAAALSVMRSGRSPAGASGSGPRTIVFHGNRDTTVHPANGERLAGGGGGAWSGREEVVTGRANGRDFRRAVRIAPDGTPAGEYWRVDGLGHAWSGGCADGSYADPEGPDASRAMMRFFLQGTPPER